MRVHRSSDGSDEGRSLDAQKASTGLAIVAALTENDTRHRAQQGVDLLEGGPHRCMDATPKTR